MVEYALYEQILVHLIFAALGALFTAASLFFGVRPFGVALAAALGSLAPACAAGGALYALLIGDYITLASVLAVPVVRSAVAVITAQKPTRVALFCEPLSYRASIAAATVLVVGVLRLVLGGFRYYDLFGVLLAVAAAPLATMLYYGITREDNRRLPYTRELGVSALVLTAIFALRSVSFFGIYPAAVVAAIAVFLVVSHKGAAIGAVGGGLCGLCIDPRIAPAFLLLGVAFGLLERSSRGGGVLGGCAAASAYAYLLFQTEGLLYLLPSVLIAGALFLAFDSAGLVAGAPAHHLLLARRRAAVGTAGEAALLAGNKRLKEMSGALQDLSGTLYEVSSRMRRPGVAEMRRLCDRAFDSVCPGCRHREKCWGSEYEKTAAALSALAKRLCDRGKAEPTNLSAHLVERCEDLPRILSVINNGAAALAEETLHGDKTAVVAMDYAAVSRAINEALEENEENYVCDTATGERIFARLLRLGYSLEAVAVCGKRRRRVLLRGVRLSGRTLKLRELRAVVERYCHFKMGKAEVTQNEGLTDIVFPEHKSLQTRCVRLSRAKGRDEGKRCGDCVTAFSGADGVEHALICDGMGSGNTAALTSALASMFLSRFLQAGGRAESSLRMLNGFLAARARRECEASTTVDLLEVDCISGQAVLYKCGAAPTYLLRRGEVTRFFSRTAPVGILEALDAERLAFAVEPGDVLVQMSDGFTCGEEDCPWLADMLKTRFDGDTEEFARRAINHASKNGSDDLSLIITEITAADEAV